MPKKEKERLLLDGLEYIWNRFVLCKYGPLAKVGKGNGLKVVAVLKAMEIAGINLFLMKTTALSMFLY